MSASQKLQWKRYVNKLRYLHDEIDLVVEISNKTGNEFQNYLETYCAKNEISLKELNKNHSDKVENAYKGLREEKTNGRFLQDNENETESNVLAHSSDAISEEEQIIEKENSEVHEAFNKLFKKLALHLHPDRMKKDMPEDEKSRHLELFNEAKESLETKRYFILLDLAEKYNISLPKNYKEQINWMRRQIDLLDQKLAGKKTTYNYLFAECESDDEKDLLVKKFIKQLFGINC
tara:strand:+ start:3727 stop:4428 length:702 start_codon:yes stop_codon:yes gene_type:complete